MSVQKVLGIDVSHHQGKMNFETAKNSGAHFVFVRVGSIDNITGICYTDFRFQENSDQAPQHLATGYYWYFRPNHDAFRQADYFCNLIKDKTIHLPPVIDVEYDGGKSPAHIGKSIYNWLTRVKENLNVKKQIIYTRATFWNPYVGYYYWAKEYDLWVARYITSDQPWSSNDKMFKVSGWDTWTFWQWSADHNMLGRKFGTNDSYSIDLNYFNGNIANLVAYVSSYGNINIPQQPTEQPQPELPEQPPPVQEPILTGVVTADVLNVRSGPGIEYLDVGDIHKGEKISIYDISGKDAWAKISEDDKWVAIKYRGKTFVKIL